MKFFIFFLTKLKVNLRCHKVQVLIRYKLTPPVRMHSMLGHHRTISSTRYLRCRKKFILIFNWIFFSFPIEMKLNQAFMRKIPQGSEADNILVGEIDCIDHSISAFVRLKSACYLGDLTEVPVPTRFLFVLLGPQRFD